MNRKQVLMLAGYNTFFWVWFWLFCYWTFPYDRVAAFISDKVSQSGAGYNLEIGELSPHWLTGVTLNDVVVRKQKDPALVAAPVAPAEKGKPVDDGSVKVKEAHARFGLFSLLFGGKSLTFDADLEQGAVEGAYEEDGEQRHIDATLSAIDIGKLGLLESVVALPAKGMLQGDFDVTLGKDPTKSNGTVKLVIKGLTLGDGVAKLKVGSLGGLTIDPVNAGDVTIDLDVKNGVGQVRKLNANGDDVVLDGNGDVRFADPIGRSRIDILLQVRFTEAYKIKTPRTKAMFSLLDANNSSQIRAAKTPDGGLAWRLSGMVSSVRAIPAGRSNARPKAAPAAPAPTPGSDDDE
ncbi:MAG: type II secretion system protein GspN [Myxococcales bacterium]